MKFQSGFYRDIDAAEYHAMDCASRSMLAVLVEGRTPAHVRYEKDHPKESTPDQNIGTAFHYRIIQPELYDQRVARGLDLPRRKHVDKKAHADHAEEHKGKLILPYMDWQTVEEMANPVFYHEAARDLLEHEDAIIEGTGLWTEEFYLGGEEYLRLDCRIRPDVFIPSMTSLVDLKSVPDASYKGFQRSIERWNYDLQAAFYVYGMRRLGFEVNYFDFICCEKKPPYLVAVWTLDPDDIEMGWMKLQPHMETMARCYESGKWPGYSDYIEGISKSQFAKRRDAAALMEEDE